MKKLICMLLALMMVLTMAVSFASCGGDEEKKEVTVPDGYVMYENGDIRYYEHKRISKGCHGTGDVYASAFTGALMNGKDIFTAAKIAADYTLLCIEKTQGDPTHWYGVKFETALADLIGMLA